MKRCACLIWLLCLVPARPLMAERLYRINGALDLVGAIDSNPQANGFFMVNNSGFAPVYALYPSVQIDSSGPNSRLQLDYAFGLDRIKSDLDLDSTSHSLGMNLSKTLATNLSLTFSNSFVRSPDFTTFNLFRGTPFTPDGSFFPSDLVALRRNSQTNTAALTLDYKLSPYSRVSFGAGHSMRNFAENADFSSALTDQSGLTANLAYTRTASERTSWMVDYSAYQYQFEGFSDARSHNIDIGFSHQLRPTVLVRAQAGPSHTEDLISGRKYTGFNGSFGVSKSFQGGTSQLRDPEASDEAAPPGTRPNPSQISLSYNRRNGTSTGFGSLSDTQDLRVDYTHPFTDRVGVGLASWLYDTRQRFDNPVRSRGLSASVVLTLVLGAQGVLNFGATYQRQGGSEFLELERQRIFVSWRFNVPSLVRFEK